jgi:hypothetical protein
MEVSWTFYRFDYARFTRLRPLLRAAGAPEDLEAVAYSPELRSILDALDDGDISFCDARGAIVREACCVGEALELGHGALHEVAALRENPRTERAGEILTALLTGHASNEPWLAETTLVLGIIAPDETRALCDSLMSVRWPGARHGRRRHGGLVGSVRGFFAGLLGRGPEQDESLLLLRDLVQEAASTNCGISLVAG